MMCAIGCLIPDEHYDDAIEGEVVGPASRVGATLAALGYIPRGMDCGDAAACPEMQLLQALQHVHDASWPDDWSNQLARVARAFGLEFKESA